MKAVAQIKPDSAAVISADTSAKVPPVTTHQPQPEKHSVVFMSFLKEKSEQSPDSVFFNILKITNTNGKDINGVVTITVPQGWKLISPEQTTVKIAPGNSEYVPVRVSLSRQAKGGISYLVNALLHSDRALFPDKNQTSVSKSCYVTIPKKTSWDIFPVQSTVYFNRFADAAPMQLMLRNRGNGNEIVKLEFTIGSSLEMHGAFGSKHFTSVELKPHMDTVLSFSMQYNPVDDAAYYNRDFRRMTVKVTATVDSTSKRTFVNFKYLESAYNNVLAERVSPLVFDMQLQNILSDFNPRMMVGASGKIFFKNDDMLDYYLRFIGLSLYGHSSAKELWQRSRMYAKYDAGKWYAIGGDIAVPAAFVGLGGRGIGGGYKINDKQTISGAVTANVASPIYSAGIAHSIKIRQLYLATSLFGVVNNYSKINNYGGALNVMFPLLPGHRLSLTVAGTQTQHLYNNTTFTGPNGNYITTNDPGAVFYGMGVRAQYNMKTKKARAELSSTITSKHFSDRDNGNVFINGHGQYDFTRRFSVITGGYFTVFDPVFYNQGIRNLENKFITGRYFAEASRKINSKVSLNAGPVFEHNFHESYKINTLNDTVRARFSSYSPKIAVRVHCKSGMNGFVTPYLIAGYTHITLAEDPTLPPVSPLFKNNFFNASAGFNAIQNNWGVNIFYYYGANDYISQHDYYYYNSFGKSIRVLPYFQKYFFNKTMLLSSHNSYSYDTKNNSENITLNANLSFFLGRDWTFNVDNNLYMFSRISKEGAKTYSRSYYLNLGIHKIFDIPQPGIKYHDVKIVCYKDINGNQMLDNDEQGLSDIVIGLDRIALKDSTGKFVKQKGLFSPVEMVTDNFGQVFYYHIPSGEYNFNILPLKNLIDLYNVNGQKQNFSITRDTTFYIPFVQSYRAIGRVILIRDEYSSVGSVSVANIRITATDSLGNSFSALTAQDGSYTLYVPRAREYKIAINNVFSDQFILEEQEYAVRFNGAKEFQVDFIFNEKKRLMNIANSNKPATAPANVTAATTSPVSSASAANPASAVNVSPDNSSGVTYRVQIASSPQRLTQAQRAKTFKGVANIQEYVEGGVYKYTAGNYSTFEFENATDYKDKLRAMGYKDAFIVFFKDNKRVATPVNPGNKTGGVKDTSSSTVPANTVAPVPAPANDAVRYRVQIASRSSQLSSSQQAQLFKGADNIKEYKEGNTYKYTSGDFADYAQATEYKNKLSAMGFKGMFVVSFKDNKRVK